MIVIEVDQLRTSTRPDVDNLRAMGGSPFLLLFTRSRRQDPYPLYERILAEVPVSDGPDGRVVLARHADCAQLLKEPLLSGDYTKGARYQELLAAGALSPERLAETDRRRLIFRDPTDHTRQLRLAMNALAPPAIEGIHPRVQTLVDELLDRALNGSGDIEFVDDFAFVLPLRILTEMLGMPAEDFPRLEGWLRTILYGRLADLVEQEGAFDLVEIAEPEEQRALANAHSDLLNYLDELIEARRARPGKDMLSKLVTARRSGHTLSTAEINTMCQLLLGAGGVDTTANMLSSGLLTLLRNPAEFDRLRDDLAIVDTTVEEVLRYEAPVQFVARFALEDLEVGGRPLSAGGSVLLLLAAANRDPERFADPQRFDAPSRHCRSASTT